MTELSPASYQRSGPEFDCWLRFSRQQVIARSDRRRYSGTAEVLFQSLLQHNILLKRQV